MAAPSSQQIACSAARSGRHARRSTESLGGSKDRDLLKHRDMEASGPSNHRTDSPFDGRLRVVADSLAIVDGRKHATQPHPGVFSIGDRRDYPSLERRCRGSSHRAPRSKGCAEDPQLQLLSHCRVHWRRVLSITANSANQSRSSLVISFNMVRGRRVAVVRFPPNNTLERTGEHRGRAVLAMDCVLGGAEWGRCPAAQLGR